MVPLEQHMKVAPQRAIDFAKVTLFSFFLSVCLLKSININVNRHMMKFTHIFPLSVRPGCRSRKAWYLQRSPGPHVCDVIIYSFYSVLAFFPFLVGLFVCFESDKEKRERREIEIIEIKEKKEEQ